MLSGFRPIETEAATVLILGTGPSVRSLLKQQYYGHERNAFWPIMERLFAQKTACYEDKWNLLLLHDVALWDVLARFERKGSADSAFTTCIPNDLRPFIDAHGKLDRILFNGQTAEKLYRRYIGYYPEHVAFRTLPSTSPAYTLSFERKEEAWRHSVLSVSLDAE